MKYSEELFGPNGRYQLPTDGEIVIDEPDAVMVKLSDGSYMGFNKVIEKFWRNTPKEENDN